MEEQLHLTWIFLGEQESVEPWRMRLCRITPLECPVLLKGVGNFGHPPRIFHANTREKRLYHKAAQMRNAGFDFYRFSPHVTLCRIKKITDWRGYKKLLEKYREKVIGEVKEEITLYESDLCSDGAVYKKIKTITM